MFNGKEKCISGAENNTTNNRMELTAVIKSLEILKEPCEVNLYSDSSYVINAFEQNWIGNWRKNNWRTANKKDVLNKDLWEKLSNLVALHTVHFIKVKGHSDNEYNNRCDIMASSEASKI